MIHRSAAILAFVIALGAGAADAQTKTCQLQSLGELKLSNNGSHLSVDATIDGKPAPLILDTGAFGTMLFADAARKLGLFLQELPNTTMYGVGGSSRAYTARVKELKVGNLVESNADLVVSGNHFGNFAGLLGAKFLFQADIEFDLAHNAVRFFKPVNCTGDQVVYWGSAYSVAPLAGALDDRPLVTVRLNGTPIQALMDTGSPRSVVVEGAAARLGKVAGADGTSPDAPMRGTAASSTVSSSIATFDSFSFGDETIGHARLRIADLFAKDTEVQQDSRLAAPAVDSPQMLLGADFFRSHRIFFAREQRKVYVSYQGGPVFAAVSP